MPDTDSTEVETDQQGPVGPTDSTDVELTDPGQSTEGDADASPEPDTFDRAYVEKLRAEAAEHRVKAKRAEEYAQEVFYGRVAALGKLADPTDLSYDEALLEDRSAMEAAIDELLTRKPHLADRRPTGDVDQGPRPQGQTVDLAGMLRSRAG